MNKKKSELVILPFAAAALIIAAMKFFSYVMYKTSYICPIFLFTGWYCPGCGATRAVRALLHGHFLRSFIYNPCVITVLIFLILFYIQAIFNVFEKKIKIIPRSKTFYIVLSGIFIFYYIARNFIDILMP